MTPLPNKICTHCSAKRYPSEPAGFCCTQGKVALAPLPELPAELVQKLTLDNEFKKHARSINQSLALPAWAQLAWCNMLAARLLSRSVGSFITRLVGSSVGNRLVMQRTISSTSTTVPHRSLGARSSFPLFPLLQ